ncbi:cytochrome c [Nitrosomonas nitrosa]|jgi:cytochrome c|uniref:Cytochrome c n=2 Tax=Nitrosomonadaceae TaxID=206379 RepID=A0A1I4TUX8_9PROT|nr:cytochrome c [Nitrosomonas nitrosa]CAE6512526.1 Cytochrome c-552 [Nitrosomonas nitrosa]SFM80370.1 cytochrome c [Nitrosomonas nitrosa]
MMRKVWLGVMAASAVMWVGSVQADADLAKNSGCLNCHNVDIKLVGPALKDVAAKYAGQEGAADYLAGKIKNGSNGVWGTIPMPPNPNVSDENAKVLADFILSLK